MSVSPSNLSSAVGLPEISLFTCEQNNHKFIATRQIRFTLMIPHQSFIAVCWKHWGHWSITAGGSIGLSNRTVSQSWEQDQAGLRPIRAQRLRVNTTTQTQGFTRLNSPPRSNCTLAPSSGVNLYTKETGNTSNTHPIFIYLTSYPTHKILLQNFFL